MYETEANRQTEPVTQVPADVVEKFRSLRESVVARTVLPWGEHCTECVWPTCYTTCDLYTPRADGRCRRFIDGMVRLDCPGSVNSYLLKIRFKRWGKLWAPGNIHLRPKAKAEQVERRDQRIGDTLQSLPFPGPVKNLATLKRYSWKKRMTVNAMPSVEVPDAFIVECYNPSDEAMSLSLTMRDSESRGAIPFQYLIRVAPGFHRETIPVERISRTFDLKSAFSIELVPNDIADGATLYFGLIDFVATKPIEPAKFEKPGRIKCVVWDLDNTLWEGILVEDGAERLKLKPGIAEVIKELDRRGILHSIASKNNFDEAMAVLKRYSMDEYFLSPQISWGPKSEGLKAIAGKINIGIDTLLLVDDSDFELAEVQAGCPAVKVLRAERYLELPELPECQVPITEESRTRRLMYQEEAVREDAAQSFNGDYFAFLRDCKIEMQIDPLTPANLERVHELTQRTNQMNFSGNRYERKLLEQIAADPHLDAYVISCRDRFGSYGIVGFSIVDSREPRMTDLMFSCRIQSKRVEHALLSYLLRKYGQLSNSAFFANYRKTPRNAPSGRVFQDMGMEEEGERGGITSLVYRLDRTIPDDGVIRIVDNQAIEAAARS